MVGKYIEDLLEMGDKRKGRPQQCSGVLRSWGWDWGLNMAERKESEDLPPFIFETGSLSEPRVHQFVKTSWETSSRDSPCFWLLKSGITGVCGCTLFLVSPKCRFPRFYSKNFTGLDTSKFPYYFTQQITIIYLWVTHWCNDTCILHTMMDLSKLTCLLSQMPVLTSHIILYSVSIISPFTVSQASGSHYSTLCF